MTKKIIDGLCEYLKLSNYRELARYIGVKPTRVYSWVKYGKITDVGLILVKNPEINPGWLYTGEGDIAGEIRSCTNDPYKPDIKDKKETRSDVKFSIAENRSSRGKIVATIEPGQMTSGLLSALVIMRCGYCGRTVKSWNNSKTRLDGTRLDYYACVTKNRKGVCPKSRMISHQVIDEKIVGNMLTTLANDDWLRECWREYCAIKRQADAGTDTLGEIGIEEEKKRKLVAAIAAGVIDFADARIEMDNIKARLAKLQEVINNAIPENEPDWDAITMTRDEWDLLTFPEHRQVISAVIDKITVYNSYAIINYAFPRTLSGNTGARVNFSLIANRPIKAAMRSR